jgi:hypothetical protein
MWFDLPNTNIVKGLGHDTSLVSILQMTALQPPRLRSVFAAAAACGLRVAYRPCSPKNLPHRSRENEFNDGRV